MTDDMVQRIAAKTNAELLEILKRNRHDYRPDVLAVAAQEAERRGLSLESQDGSDESNPTTEFVADIQAGASYYAAGRIITCTHCTGTRFYQRRALLSSRALAALDLDWLDAGAFALTCVACRRIEWFSHLDLPE